MRAAVMEEDGTPISGLEYETCVAVQGDSVRTSVTWSAGDSLASPKGRYVRLGFRLERARIYSFWVE